MRLRCIIIDDEPVARKLLKEYIEDISFLEIAGEADNPLKAQVILDREPIDLIFLDINMPKLDGIEATQRIKANSIRIAILGLSVHGEGHATDAMLRAGAVAVVLKERAVEDLYNAIKRALTLPLDTTSVRADNPLKCRPEFILEQAPELNSDPM